MKITITKVGVRYVVQVPGSVDRILTLDSLKTQLRKTLLLNGSSVLSVILAVESFGSFQFDPEETYVRKVA